MGTYSDAYISRDRKRGLPSTLRVITKVLGPRRAEFEAIVVSGLSGIIPGAIIAQRWKKQLVVVRKDDEPTHGKRLEGFAHYANDPGFKRGMPYVVLDDFIARGGTMRRIYTTLMNRGHALPVYTMLYDGSLHYPVPMVVNPMGDEPLNQWYMGGKPVDGTELLYTPVPQSGQWTGENVALWRQPDGQSGW